MRGDDSGRPHLPAEPSGDLRQSRTGTTRESGTQPLAGRVTPPPVGRAAAAPVERRAEDFAGTLAFRRTWVGPDYVCITERADPRIRLRVEWAERNGIGKLQRGDIVKFPNSLIYRVVGWDVERMQYLLEWPD